MVKIGDKTITQIYRGSELITDDSNNTKNIKLGNKPVNFVYQGNELLYPNPVKDGLVLWYDFKTIKNTSFNNTTATNLYNNNNNNNGILKNFSYNGESGYNNGLKFDGIDDYISLDMSIGKNFSISTTVYIDNVANNYILSSSNVYFYLRKSGYHLDLSIVNNLSRQELFRVDNFFVEFLNKKINISYVIDSDNKKVYLYINHSLYKTFNMGEVARSNMNITGIGVWNNNYFFKGSIYSFKVYNKSLSNDEIEHNYNLEKERWGI